SDRRSAAACCDRLVSRREGVPHRRASARGARAGSDRWEAATMANKASFTPEEWRQLLESPMLASMAVTAAEPSGLWGTLKESLAAGGALAKARADVGTNELIREVVAEFGTAEGRGAARDGL